MDLDSFFRQFLSSAIECAFSVTGWHYPGHFQFPFLSKTLREFWGKRWASWVADWFHQMVFTRYKRRPALGLFLVFFYSGLWHELLINVPLYLFSGVNVLGTQIVYFLIQALGIVGEKELNMSDPLRRLYLWGIVLVPAPLVVNEGVLRVTGMFFNSM